MNNSGDLPRPNHLPRGHILLVDDDEAVRLSLRLALEWDHYRVILAPDGAEALNKLEKNQIDLVLLDLDLPIMDGWAVFERMTAISPFLPIILITARPDQYELAAAAGATALMEKPLCLPLLSDTIGQILRETFEQRVRRILSNRPLVLAGSQSH